MLLSAMDKPHWPQEIVMKPMDQILLPNTTNSSSNNNNNNNHSNLSKPSSSSSSFERRVIRPQKAAPAAVNCPRCDSINTKFCYYNNYSLSQPRYFCKTCRRYWTAGGTLRNIPVGGGSRKNKRSSSSASSKFPDPVVPSTPTAVLSQPPRIHDHDHQYGQDLNLGFPPNFKNVLELTQAPNFNATRNTNSSTSNPTTHGSGQMSGLELLTGVTTSSFMPVSVSDHNSVYTQPGQLMIPSLSFSLNGGGAYGINSFHESDGGRLLFPFEEVKTDTSAAHDDHDGGQSKDDQNCDSNGFWNGMMGGSNSW